jgi:hypothetical protein
VVTVDGKLVEGFLTGGAVHDVRAVSELSEDRVGCAVIAYRGYDRNEFRCALEGNNTKPVIPGRKNLKEAIDYDQDKE